MKLTNDSYVILIGSKNFTERYYRDKTGWLKVSARGRKSRMTAEQVLSFRHQPDPKSDPSLAQG